MIDTICGRARRQLDDRQSCNNSKATILVFPPQNLHQRWRAIGWNGSAFLTCC